jgi:hypothetical protein
VKSNTTVREQGEREREREREWWGRLVKSKKSGGRSAAHLPVTAGGGGGFPEAMARW